MSLFEKKALQLEDEVRRLKMELLKQELSDKLIVLNAYLEAKAKNSSGLEKIEVTTNDSADVNARFESVLFASVSGELLVWHCVLIMLFLWLLAGRIFNYYYYYIIIIF